MTASVVVIGNIGAVAIIVLANVIGSMWLAPALVLGIICGYVGLSKPLEVGVGLMVAGPVLLSTIRVSSLTGDNVAVLLGCGYVLVWMLRANSVRVTALVVFPSAIAFAVVLSGLVNGVPYLQVGVRFASLALLTLVAPFLHRNILENIIRVTLLIGVASIFMQVATRFVQPFYDADGSVRYGGLMGHPNFGSYLLGSYIIYILARRSVSKTGALICTLGLLAMLLAASQTALIFLAVVGGVVLLRYPIRLFAAFVLVSSGIAVLGSTFLDRVMPFLESGSLASSSSGSWRLSQWQAALKLVDPPNFFGIGWQQTKVLIGDGLGAHSGYVTAYVELGLVGCIVVGFGLLRIIVAVRRSWPVLCVWFYILLCSLTDPVIFYPSCICLALALSVIDHRPAPERFAGAIDRRATSKSVSMAV